MGVDLWKLIMMGDYKHWARDPKTRDPRTRHPGTRQPSSAALSFYDRNAIILVSMF